MIHHTVVAMHCSFDSLLGSSAGTTDVLFRTRHVLGQPSDKITVELGLVVVHEVAAAATAKWTLAFGAETRLRRHLWGNRLAVDVTVDVLVF
jgi:hypothetical protein